MAIGTFDQTSYWAVLRMKMIFVFLDSSLGMMLIIEEEENDEGTESGWPRSR